MTARLSKLGWSVEKIKEIKRYLIETNNNYEMVSNKFEGLTPVYAKRIARGERWSSIKI